MGRTPITPTTPAVNAPDVSADEGAGSAAAVDEAAVGSTAGPAGDPAARPADAHAAPDTVEAAAGMDGAAVSAEGLTRRFDDVTAVSDISFSVPAGSVLGIIGPSGSGKTTTIRMLMGSLAPTEGKVRVLGEAPVRFRRETRERIGYMPQQFTLYPDLTTKENVDFVGSLFGLLTFRRRKRVRQVLELLDLWDARGRRASDLSGGMQRRLELACALAHEPHLLILDEPTAGIDPILRKVIWDELHRLKGTGVTVLVTTQYVTEAEECDLVALVAEGQLIAFDTPDGVRRQAFGGDIVEITTEGVFDAAALTDSPLVHGIRQNGLRDFRAVVDEAGTAIPELVAAVNAAGGEVVATREARPSFEEVFTELVERNGRRLEAKAAADARAEAGDESVASDEAA